MYNQAALVLSLVLQVSLAALASDSLPSSAQCTAIHPPPKVPHSGGRRHICQKRGRINPKKIQTDDFLLSQPAFVPSAAGCLALCNLLPAYNKLHEAQQRFASGCSSFGYNETSSLCHLYYRTLYDGTGLEFKADPSSDTIFSSPKCFDCPKICDTQQIGVNVIANSGFEFSSKYIGPWYTSKPDVSLKSPGHGSALAYGCYSGEGPVFTACELAQQFEACFEKYSLRFDIRSDSGQLLTLYASGTQYYGIFQPPDPKSWFTYEISLDARHADTPVNERYALISLEPDANANSTIDNVQVVPLPSPIPTKAGSPNLLRNPGFETGAISPWKVLLKDRPSYITPHGIGADSKYAFELPIPASGGEEKVVLRQAVDAIVGLRYVLSFDYAIGGQATYVQVHVKDPASHLGEGLVWRITNNGPLDSNPNQTMYFEQIFTALSTRPRIIINMANFNCCGNPSGGPLILDNFSVKELA